MYKPKIFLVNDESGNLVTLEETGYLTEDILQSLLVSHPDLLPGDQIDPENPRRWLLVAREMSVPDSADGTGRWSLDHLFLDQDGIPTFVECKRAVDTRTRREVVAQMLDYAANGVEYWSIDHLRQTATETAQRLGIPLDEQILELVGNNGETDIEVYWETVEANLRNGRVRLVFVADSTPKELRRLVEFLNAEMTNVEVLAVEIKQFQRQDNTKQKALVPRVVGFTEAARSAKGKPSTKRKQHTTLEEFMFKCEPVARGFFQRVLKLAQEKEFVIYWGTVGFSVRAKLPSGSLASFVYGYPPDEFSFYFGYTSLLPEGKKSSALRRSLLDYGVFKESGKWTLRTSVMEDNLELLNEVYAYIIDQVTKFVEARRK